MGEKLAALLDPDVAVDGVTAGTIRPELVHLAELSVLSAASADLSVTAQWGTLDSIGRVNPGPGSVVERSYDPSEKATEDRASLLGGKTCDVFLNKSTYWKNVPEVVWRTQVGGYQVLKKWLSYRHASILKRPLTATEAAHVTDTARRLTSVVLMSSDLDENFKAARDTHEADDGAAPDAEAVAPMADANS